MYIPFWNRTSRLQLQAFIIMVLLGVLTHAGATPTARDDLWVTNGTVYSSVTYGNNTGYSTGSGVGLDTIGDPFTTTRKLSSFIAPCRSVARIVIVAAPC